MYVTVAEMNCKEMFFTFTMYLFVKPPKPEETLVDNYCSGPTRLQKLRKCPNMHQQPLEIQVAASGS